MTKEIRKIESFKVNHDENVILTRCEDVILEAKRVILNEDKIANVTLANMNNSEKNLEFCSKQCRDSLDWRNELFWKELPNPKNSLGYDPYSKQNNKLCNDQKVDMLILRNLPSFGRMYTTNDQERKCGNIVRSSDIIQINNQKMIKKPKKLKTHLDELTKKYFDHWREVAALKKKKSELIYRKLEQRDKLDKFIRNLKKHKKQHNDQQAEEKTDCKDLLKQEKSTSNYKNRFNAQKNIIDKQKAKLIEQDKIIGELKLGIIREDLYKSIENTKVEIREIFSKCSEKIKCKAPLVFIEERQNLLIKSQKVPKVVQQMEERAIKRAQNREIILERKRLIEETRQRMVEEAIENKRVIEEEERKRNLEVIKERRRKELELEKIRQANKQRYLEHLNMAITYHNQMLIRRSFQKLFNYYKENKVNFALACQHYDSKLKQKCMSKWLDFIEDRYKMKYEVAHAHFAYTLLKRTIVIWHHVYIEAVRNYQVAEDFYDFRLTSNIFSHWHRVTCKQIMIEYKNIKIAEKHHNRRILFHYFYLWRSLPVVIQLEKAKELKKRKWREKVWEIVPDYKPPEDI